MLTKILVDVTVMKCPHDLIDACSHTKKFFRANEELILKRAIRLSIDDPNADVAYVAYTFFRLPQHGIDRAIKILNQEAWSINRLLEKITGLDNLRALLHIARLVNMMTAHFSHFEQPETYWFETMTRYIDLCKSTPEHMEMWHMVNDFYNSRDMALSEAPYQEGRVKKYARKGCGDTTRINIQRQFWIYELQCRAKTLDNLGVECGGWVAAQKLSGAVEDYIFFCGIFPMHCFAWNANLGMDEARDIAWSHGCKETRALGVQMAEYWLSPSQDGWEWNEKAFISVEKRVEKMKEYFLGLQAGYMTIKDPWFQVVEAPVVRAKDGEHDDPLFKRPTHAQDLPRIF